MRGTDNFVARRDSLAAPSGVGRFVVPGLGLGCLLSYVLCFVRRFDAGLAPAGFERLTTFMYGALIALALAGFASLALGGGARAARRGEAAEGGGERLLFIGRGRDRFKLFFGSHSEPPVRAAGANAPIG